MLGMELLQKLNHEQRIAATHTQGPLLVLAGAGSGKTRVVTYRVAYLLSMGISPQQILAVTFTNKAAQEMQQRIQNVLQNAASSPTICTFHSLGVRILRESISHLGYSPDFLIYDEEDSSKLLRGCLLSAQAPKEADLFKSIQAAISQAKNQCLPSGTLPASRRSAEHEHLFQKVYTLYQQRLQEAQAVDFDDLLFLTVRLFQEHPHVLEAYQKRWSYLLIDEYQDTNHAQYLMARFLVQKSRNLFVVGDPDQSIYSWRGANIHNILHFEEDYPGAKVVRLQQNYRSHTNILNAANALIQNNASRFEKVLWSDRGEGEKISLYIGDNEHEEAYFVAQAIEKIHLFHKVPLKEMAIFYRTNFQSRLFEDALLRRRIPYTIVGGISFYQRKEIKDLLAFLRMILSDYDTVSFERTVNLPKRGLGLTTIEKIRQASSQAHIPILTLCRKLVEDKEEGIRLTGAQKLGLQEYVNTLTALRALQQEGSLSQLVTETIQKTRYLDVLREDKETFEDRKENLSELIAKAYEWETQSGSSSLNQFLEELSLKSAWDETNQAEDQIHLMTLHNGKGLEFRTAFLVGMEEDLFPHANSRDTQEKLEEERRLCYVGITRAKERLYLSAARARFLWGGTRGMRPSRFLKEIPKEYLQRCTG